VYQGNGGHGMMKGVLECYYSKVEFLWRRVGQVMKKNAEDRGKDSCYHLRGPGYAYASYECRIHLETLVQQVLRHTGEL